MTEKNEILDELWKIRLDIEEENDKSIEKIFQKYFEQQQKDPSRYFSGKPVTIRSTKVA